MQKFQPTLPIGSIIHDPAQCKYVVEALLGKGGFGPVYLVRQEETQAIFALKELVDPNKQQRNQFIFEGNVLKKLHNPALPRVYRVFDDPVLPCTYMLMDYIKGADLEHLRLEQPGGRIPLEQAITIMSPIIDAVSFLHKQEPPIIHRDIKPANIIVPVANDKAVLVDFGIAKAYDPDGTTSIIRHGTPGFAAPELYGKGTNTRTDIYGLGATLYTLLSGTIPPDAVDRLMEKPPDDPLTPLQELVPTIPQGVAAAIHRALAVSSIDRFSSVDDFWQAIIKHVDDQDTPESSSETAPVAQPDELKPLGKQARITPLLERNTKQKTHSFWIALPLVIISLLMAAWLLSTQYHPAPVASPTPLVRATQAPTPSPIPSPTPTHPSNSLLSSQYTGIIKDLMNNAKTPMILSNVQQNGTKITGNFTGLGLSAPFTGSVDKNGHLTFTVMIYNNSSTLAFEGNIQIGGNIAGSFRALNQFNQFTGESGIWSVGPSS